MRAAGGIVWRRDVDALRVLVAHRPRYDDWSFPKGKREDDESDEACALREVEEETGLSCALGAELPATSYSDDEGRSKTVRYWEMTSSGGEFVPNDEVDEVRWLPLVEARAMLSYGPDRDVLDALVDLLEGAERA